MTEGLSPADLWPVMGPLVDSPPPPAPEPARAAIEMAATIGDPAAARRLADLILHDATDPDQIAASVLWMRKAAEAGDPGAMTMLAALLVQQIRTGGDMTHERLVEIATWTIRGGRLGEYVSTAHAMLILALVGADAWDEACVQGLCPASATH